MSVRVTGKFCQGIQVAPGCVRCHTEELDILLKALRRAVLNKMFPKLHISFGDKSREISLMRYT